MQTIVDDDGVMHEVYTKKEVMDMLEQIKTKIDETYKHFEDKHLRYGLSISKVLIDDSIDELKGRHNK